MVSSPSLDNRLRFGPFELDPGNGELRRSGAPIRLSPQPLKLLALLASRPGDVVSRDEIRDRLWGSETFVDFEQGVNHCIRSIRAVLEQGPRSAVYIETVPRRGYRFVAPVASEPAGLPANGGPDLQLVPTRPAPRPAWAGLYGRLGEWFGRLIGRPARAQAELRVAVLPFDDLTGEAERVSLSGGLTEEINTHLSRVSGERLRLVSARSAKVLKQTPHLFSAARQKGVDFLIGGSVWSIADRARVNVHLVRVRDETQLWTESYERTLHDVLDFHTEVARAIVDGARARLEG